MKSVITIVIYFGVFVSLYFLAVLILMQKMSIKGNEMGKTQWNNTIKTTLEMRFILTDRDKEKQIICLRNGPILLNNLNVYYNEFNWTIWTLNWTLTCMNWTIARWIVLKWTLQHKLPQVWCSPVTRPPNCSYPPPGWQTLRWQATKVSGRARIPTRGWLCQTPPLAWKCVYSIYTIYRCTMCYAWAG